MAQSCEFGELKKMGLRECWPHEAQDFTPWLCENLDYLSDILGIDLECVEREANVGKYNIDILAKDMQSEKWVIIENQLGKTDHDHLGKLITYAAGIDASYIVWIVGDVNEEHRQAVDWLNANTDDIYFFLIQAELWQIDNSKKAIRFNKIATPNDWTKVVRRSRESAESELRALQLEFWTSMIEYIKKRNRCNEVSWRKPHPQHWYSLALGTTRAQMLFTINSRKKEIGIQIHIPNDKDLYDELRSKKQQIEAQLGFGLDWQRLDDKQASRIMVTKKCDINDKEDWPHCFDWIIEKCEKLQKVFRKYL